jgi:ketosteroid isomerase-like protein
VEPRAMSRRTALVAGACALAAAVGIPTNAAAHAETGLTPANEELVRNWYAGWEQKDWHPLDVMLADDFTFSSAYGDDHISKSAFKARCWLSQIGLIDHFDLIRVIGNGNDAFVMYVCHTKNGKSFRNVEFLQFRNGKVAAIECYFGGQAGFPSAANSGQT